jgi:CelD/BcsL family acetyltransferase involved in cellulose biosynthesis
VADAVAEALGGAQPRPVLVSLEGLPSGSPWPLLLKQRIGGALGAAWYLTGVQDAPVVTLSDGDFDGWLASKSSNFRSQMKRARRKIEKEGGVIRMSDAASVEADIDALFRLHEGRWEGRGESGILGTGLPGMMRDAAGALLEQGRFRLAVIEFEGRAISAQLFMAAGGEVAYWNGGFDEEWARYKPAMVAIFFAIEHAFASGDDRLDLGGGAQDYKLRFADSIDPIQWGGVLRRGPRWPLVGAQLAPEVARRIALGALSEERRNRLKKLLRR